MSHLLILAKAHGCKNHSGDYIRNVKTNVSVSGENEFETVILKGVKPLRCTFVPLGAR